MVATLPVPLAVASGMNALTHPAVALYARRLQPPDDTTTPALAGAVALIHGLSEVAGYVAGLKARSRPR